MALLCYDIGGTDTKWGIVADDAVVRRGHLRSGDGPEHIVRTIVRVYDQAEAEHGPLDGYAIAIAAQVDPRTRRIRSAPHLALNDVDLIGLLADELERAPLVLCNDMTASCAGEADPDATTATLFVGSGLGSKFAVNGAVVEGQLGMAGDVGHLVWRPNGRGCACGRRGCVEAYCGWVGMQRVYRAHKRTLRTPGQVVDEARSGDFVAQNVLDEALDAAAFAACALCASCNPAELRLGGGVVAAWGSLLVDAVAAQVRERVWAGETIRVLPARHGADAPLLGLQRLARHSTAIGSLQSSCAPVRDR